jgi:hypothetical protein
MRVAVEQRGLGAELGGASQARLLQHWDHFRIN